MFCCFTSDKPEKNKKEERTKPLPSTIVKEIVPLSLGEQISLSFGKDFRWTANVNTEGRTKSRQKVGAGGRQKLRQLQQRNQELIRKQKNLQQQIQRINREYQQQKVQLAKNDAVCTILEYMNAKEKVQIYRYEDRIKIA